MNIPLYSFLILYGLFLSVFFIFLFINLNHLFNTGTLTPLSLFITIIVFSLACIVLFFTWIFLRDIRWNESIPLFENSSFTSPFKEKLF